MGEEQIQLIPSTSTCPLPVNDEDHLEAIKAQLENYECPTAGPTTCAQSDLRSHFNGQEANKLCSFVCPNVESTDPNDLNSGYVCHDTNHQTKQYNWCCMSPGKTIKECSELPEGPTLVFSPPETDDPIERPIQPLQPQQPSDIAERPEPVNNEAEIIQPVQSGASGKHG